MPNRRLKTILFIEPVVGLEIGRPETPAKMGFLYMNRFAIDEDDCHEILKVYELEKAYDMYDEKITNDDWNALKGQDFIFYV